MSPLLISKGLPSLAAWWPLRKAQPTMVHRKAQPVSFPLRSSRTAGKQQARLLQTCISTGTQPCTNQCHRPRTPAAAHTPIHTDPTMLAASSWCCTCAQQPQFYFSNKNYCPLPHKCVYLPQTVAEIRFDDWDQPLQAGLSSQRSKEQRQHSQPSAASTLS